MKRVLSFLLIPILLLTLWGCSGNDIEPAHFYYIRKNFDYNSTDGVFVPKTTDSAQYITLNAFISEYLRGPDSTNLVSPFPSGTSLVNLDENGETLVVTLSDSFAALTGIELSLACCAFAKTAIEFSGASVVEISALSEMLDGVKTITITAEDIILFDHVQTPSLEKD